LAYKYTAYAADGRVARGKLNVDNEEDAERILWDRGLTVVEIKPAAADLELARLFPTFFGPKRRDVIIFTQQLANLYESGVAIIPALQLLADESSNKALRSVLRQILDDVRIGTSLSAAMERHELVFPPIYTRMIRVGERTGNLGIILRRLAEYMEKELSTAQKLRSAMMYPAFILVLAFVVVGILINFTLPPLLSLYEEFDANVPTITQILLSVSGFLLRFRFHLFVLIVALILTGYTVIRRPWGRWRLDLLLLRMPILGKINLQGNIARLTRTLATLLQAGLALPESMALTRQTVTNVRLAEGLEKLRYAALQGRGISEPLSKLELFPNMLAQVVRVGEETGTLDSHLITMSDFYDEEVDRSLTNLTTFLEPAMIIFVGVIVAFVAISVIFPMYSLLGAIK
jgi:type IV pilus assembly protein PilC